MNSLISTTEDKSESIKRILNYPLSIFIRHGNLMLACLIICLLSIVYFFPYSENIVVKVYSITKVDSNSLCGTFTLPHTASTRIKEGQYINIISIDEQPLEIKILSIKKNLFNDQIDNISFSHSGNSAANTSNRIGVKYFKYSLFRIRIKYERILDKLYYRR